MKWPVAILCSTAVAVWTAVADAQEPAVGPVLHAATERDRVYTAQDDRICEITQSDCVSLGAKIVALSRSLALTETGDLWHYWPEERSESPTLQ